MLKIDVIRFEAQDVVASSIPDIVGTTVSSTLDGDNNPSSPTESSSSYVSSDSANEGLFS